MIDLELEGVVLVEQEHTVLIEYLVFVATKSNNKVRNPTIVLLELKVREEDLFAELVRELFDPFEVVRASWRNTSYKGSIEGSHDELKKLVAAGWSYARNWKFDLLYLGRGGEFI